MPLHFPAPFVLFDEKPAGRCALCHAPFYSREMGVGGNFEKHVLSHSHEEVRSWSPMVQAPGLWDSEHEASGDVEWGRYIKRQHAERPEDWRKWMLTDDAG